MKRKILFIVLLVLVATFAFSYWTEPTLLNDLRGYSLESGFYYFVGPISLIEFIDDPIGQVNVKVRSENGGLIEIFVLEAADFDKFDSGDDLFDYLANIIVTDSNELRFSVTVDKFKSYYVVFDNSEYGFYGEGNNRVYLTYEVTGD